MVASDVKKSLWDPQLDEIFKTIDVNKDGHIDLEEMKKADSKSKYVHVVCARHTIPLTHNDQRQDENIEIRKEKTRNSRH